MKTEWTDTRLRCLFDRYNRIYWRGRLTGYRALRAGLSENCFGICYAREKRIEIDTNQHTSDREIRATLLHEMAHAAARELGHGVRFFTQIERLIRLGAPISVNSPEAGRAQILHDIVPRRFPLLRAKMQRVENRRQRSLVKMARKKKLNTYTMTDDMIVMEFEDVAPEVTWKLALLCVGLENGLIDELGRPVNAWARRVVRRGKKAYDDARREHLAYEKRWHGILQPIVNPAVDKAPLPCAQVST